MSEPRFNYRGLRIGLAGFGLAGVAAGLAQIPWLPRWLVMATAATGIALGWLGGGFHLFDMAALRRADARERQAWIARHGDPDPRDDPRIVGRSQ